MAVRRVNSGGSRQRVAVIGAGPAGLAMAHQLLLLDAASEFEVVVFERRDGVGGVWRYDADPGPCVIRYDDKGKAYPLWAGSVKDGDASGCFQPPGPMYDGLRTNLPCDIMTYRSRPYPNPTDLFPSRKTVQEYIEAFAADTMQEATSKGEVDVRYGTSVKHLVRTSYNPSNTAWGAGSTWSLTSSRTDTPAQDVTEDFDKVVLASGRCNTPNVPFVPGLWCFRGTVLHSAWWRSPIPFRGRTVLVVGNSSSGSDIARELAGYVLRTLPQGQTATDEWVQDSRQGRTGTTVLHSYEDVGSAPPLDFDPRDQASPQWAKRIHVVPKIVRIESAHDTTTTGVVHFEDGTQRTDIDTIIFGTGYSYDLPYLPHNVAPFDKQPLLPHPPSHSSATDVQQSLADYFAQPCANPPYQPPHRLAPFLTNLDDWSLFYRPDPSICVLGAPIRIVPFPITQVQSRIVAAFWSGRLTAHLHAGLPKLDTRISTTQPDRWTNWKKATQQQQQDTAHTDEEEPNKTSDLGYPADTAYQNALLELLPSEMRIPGSDESRTVPDRSGSAQGQEGNLTPVIATDEGWRTMPTFRNERRVDTKRLRRRILGY